MVVLIYPTQIHVMMERAVLKTIFAVQEVAQELQMIIYVYPYLLDVQVEHVI